MYLNTFKIKFYNKIKGPVQNIEPALLFLVNRLFHNKLQSRLIKL
ncbi:hypothetical protein SAMN05421594_0977 [Chryseobacterium oleae]|uniref:Uncharacterized protein n=1 Tax=Chryseobacterium oleae TaxID=491207 RepID=A0A1I4W746_CHROL|nr:hypothetical protein SAMN05421594_0977 [Chryseobacterium oleae]